MRRFLVVVGLAASLGAAFCTVPAGAGQGNDVTFMLSCDKGVTATVAVDFVANSGGDMTGLTCAIRRAVVPVRDPETAVIVKQFDVSTDPEGCADLTHQVALPARIDCGPKAGARLTVR